MAEILEQYNTDEWEVETPTGWQSFSGVAKTEPYRVWEITTNKTVLKCADNHIVHKQTAQYEYAEVYTKDLVPGDILLCEGDSHQIVLSVQETEQTEEMYDLLDVENGNIFYSNGILSHNSVTVGSYLLHYILFNANVNVAVLANKGDLSKEILDRIKKSYEGLPKWLQQGILEWNKTSIQLENGSKIMCSTTSASAVRGQTYNLLVLDEFSFVPTNIADEFFTSVYPTISSGNTTKIVIISTPKGLNHFYKMWKDAVEKRSNYVPITIKWDDVPGRDEKFKETTMKGLGNSEQRWLQEYEAQFIGSENTLINPSKLQTLVYQDPIMHSPEGLDVYAKAQKDHIYTLCVDPSRGTGQDYHAFSVIDVTSFPNKMVAKYRNNTLSPQLLPEVVFRVGMEYNEAHVLVEINDNGQQVADLLHSDLEYTNIFFVSAHGKKGQRIDGGFGKSGFVSQPGIKTSFATKAVGCSILKEMIENEKLIIPDFETIAELSTFVKRNKGYEATEGYNDDLCMTLVLFGWLSTQPYYRDIVNVDIRRKIFSEKLLQLEEDMIPFGFISDGLEDDLEEVSRQLSSESPSVPKIEKPEEVVRYREYNDPNDTW